MSSTTRTVIDTKSAPSAFPGLLSQGIAYGGMVYCSGALGIDPETKDVVGPGVSERAARALKNLEGVLKAGGSAVGNIVKVTIYLTDMQNYAAVNKVYEAWLREHNVPLLECPVSSHLLCLNV